MKIIDGDRTQLATRYFRMEFLGYGLYLQMSKRLQRKNPMLAKRLEKVGNDEYKHGQMFMKLLTKQTGKSYNKGKWIFAGKIAGMLIWPIPTKTMVKKLSQIEQEAVNALNEAFSSGRFEGEPILKCLKAIYKDELDHSKVYGEFYA